MKSHIKIFYYIGYVTVKENVEISSVNHLSLIFRYINGYFKEINENNI